MKDKAVVPIVMLAKLSNCLTYSMNAKAAVPVVMLANSLLQLCNGLTYSMKDKAVVPIVMLAKLSDGLTCSMNTKTVVYVGTYIGKHMVAALQRFHLFNERQSGRTCSYVGKLIVTALQRSRLYLERQSAVVLVVKLSDSLLQLCNGLACSMNT